jgi:Cu(I)/Ag(I) efflux system membrane protein CusA/SilA
VGFIALFGTAVQTGMVMVIYLEDAVARKQREAGGTLTRAALREAVVEGALLRLRPKVMTVSTVVAGLLPIMWSTRVGAEVMKPLAAPVLGGMVSSLVHVLVVTPVVFFWVRERRLGLHREGRSESTGPRLDWRRPVVAVAAIVLMAVVTVSAWRAWRGREPAVDREAEAGRIVQTLHAEGLEIVLRSPTGRLSTGRNAFAIEFRSPSGRLVDVGTVRASANMPMPGMVMPGRLELTRSGVAGRYPATADFGMAGAWQMAIEWDGPAGRGSVSFEGAVR